MGRITIDELEAMTPEQRRAWSRARMVTDWEALPPRVQAMVERSVERARLHLLTREHPGITRPHEDAG